MSASSKPIPIALPNDMIARLDVAAKKRGGSRANVMREAIEIGLEHLRRIGYDVAGAVLDKSKAMPPELSLVANDALPYRVSSPHEPREGQDIGEQKSTSAQDLMSTAAASISARKKSRRR